MLYRGAGQGRVVLMRGIPLLVDLTFFKARASSALQPTRPQASSSPPFSPVFSPLATLASAPTLVLVGLLA